MPLVVKHLHKAKASRPSIHPSPLFQHPSTAADNPSGLADELDFPMSAYCFDDVGPLAAADDGYPSTDFSGDCDLPML